MLRVVWRIIALVNTLSCRELNPRSFERFERHALRHDQDGVEKILASSDLEKRRHRLAGGSNDYERGRGYLQHYRPFMDYADLRAA